MKKQRWKWALGLALSLTVALPALPAVPAAAAPALPEVFVDLEAENGENTPFKPAHMYGSMQNAPDFTWPRITGAAAYDLCVARDEALTDVAYSAEKLPYHYYNFPYTFEPGTYYWAVRYYDSAGQVSDWSTPRRFRLDPDAFEFTVPDLDEIVAAVPQSHPRIWFTSETVDQFRNNARSTPEGQELIAGIVEKADAAMERGPSADPVIQTGNGQVADAESTLAAGNEAYAEGQYAQAVALAYYFTGEEKYRDMAIAYLTNFTTWDPDGATSMHGNDQAFFDLLSRMSTTYDWMYNEMTPEQRKLTGDYLKARFDVVSEYSLETIRATPYNSHIWSYMANYGVACIALMYDYPDMANYYQQFLPLYVANFVPMANEDGGWSKGTAYWGYAYTRDKLLVDVLQQGGYLNMYDKAWCQNEYLWAMYMAPVNCWGSFGDEAGRGLTNGSAEIVTGLAKDALYTNNPVAAWARDQIGGVANIKAIWDNILVADSFKIQPKEPSSYPRAHLFQDQGMAALHSSLVDSGRISLYFRSGKYGSYNHMHCDENSFIIEAYGTRLAVNSGYYDAYHSTHDSGFTRKTYAHNSITYDVGAGQEDDNIDANGNVDMFVTQSDFDAVVGDGTKAYAGGLDKFVRSIIYVRPDTYIVVDDLSKPGNPTNFEWWLNSPTTITATPDGTGAQIINGSMALDAKVHYPEGVVARYCNLFSGPELVNVPPEGRYASSPVPERLWFEIPKVNQTKMVTTMNVHTSNTQAKYVKQTDYPGYVELEFEDGTVAYVNTGVDNTRMIEAGDVTFNGTAVVFNDSSVMLVGGSHLEMNGQTLVDSENVVTVCIGKNQVEVSSNQDYAVTVGTGNDYLPQVTKLQERLDDRVRELQGPELTGIGAEYGENTVTITAQKGHYALLAEGTPLPGMDAGNLSYELVVDGESQTYEVPATYDPGYERHGTAAAPLEEGMYLLVSKTDGILIDGSQNTTTPSRMSPSSVVTVQGENNRIELRHVNSQESQVTQVEDGDALKAQLAAFSEAEDYSANFGSGRFFQGLPRTFMNGLSKQDSINDYSVYTLTVPEDGYYDVALRYAAWMEPLPRRSVQVGEELRTFTLLPTAGWGGNGPEDFEAAVVETGFYLTAGEHDVIVGVVENGESWNWDWIGLMKRSE